jgi:Uma2 family endonuclease
VEVLSPANNDAQIAIKLRHYLAAGTTVWVFDPDERTVSVHRPSGETRTLNADEALDGGDLLPGFALRLADVFAL